MDLPYCSPAGPLPAVLMGALILLAAACGLAFWRLRWRRTAATATALLWLDVALLLLLGAGEPRLMRLAYAGWLAAQAVAGQRHPLPLLPPSCRCAAGRLCRRIRFLQVSTAVTARLLAAPAAWACAAAACRHTPQAQRCLPCPRPPPLRDASAPQDMPRTLL